MSQPEEGVSIQEFLRRARQNGQRIDGQAIKRSDEAVRSHEQRFHSGANAQGHALGAGDPITDELIISVMLQAEQEESEPASICQVLGIPWGRFRLALKDYERRQKEEELKLRYSW